jgi:hypothetical protein
MPQIKLDRRLYEFNGTKHTRPDRHVDLPIGRGGRTAFEIYQDHAR